MGKEKKNRNKKGEYGNSSKEDLDFLSDPMFAKAHARTEVMPKGWATGANGPAKGSNGGPIAKLVAEGSSENVEDIPEIEYEGEEQDDETEENINNEELEDYLEEDVAGEEQGKGILADPQTLGKEDPTQDIRPNVSGKEGPGGNKHSQGKTKQTWASLFIGNRQRSEGTTLHKVEVGDGPVQILLEDVEQAASRWEHTLIGYFGGRFPGKKALNTIVDAWKVEVSVHHHSSGWIIFEFNENDTKTQVLQGGPYMIYGRPLLLKIMPKYFTFGNEDISCLPVWIRLTNLPLPLWGIKSLDKICSTLGNPICVDKFTAESDKFSYARALIEIDVAKEVPKHVEVTLPCGKSYSQAIYYENLPKFCSNCMVMGHSDKTCKILESIEAKKAVEAQTSSRAGSENAVQNQTSDMVASDDPANEKGIGTGDVTAIEKEHGHKETESSGQWIVKKTKVVGKGQPENTKAGKSDLISTGNMFTVLEVIPEGPDATAAQSQVQMPNEQPTDGPKTNSEQQTQDPESSTCPSKIQVGGEIYIQLAAPQKKGNSQIARKPAATAAAIATRSHIQASNSTNLSHGSQPTKREEGKRRNERKKSEKSGKAVSTAEFYADMGRDSPIQANQ